MATQLTGNVEILRIWELLEKILSPSELADYSLPIDSQLDENTKRIPLDKLRDILVSTGLWNDRGGFDASTNIFPEIGGSGISNTILRGNTFYITVGGTLGAVPVIPGMVIFSKTDLPGQIESNWLFIGGSGLSQIYTDESLSGSGSMIDPLRLVGTIPTLTSELTNDSNFITEEDQPWVINPNKGYLYNYYVLANLANSGWHVPTIAEYNQVISDLVANGFNQLNDNLFESDLDLGFNAMNSGYRTQTEGLFLGANPTLYLGTVTTASLVSAVFAAYQFGIYEGELIFGSGFSVRLFSDTPGS